MRRERMGRRELRSARDALRHRERSDQEAALKNPRGGRGSSACLLGSLADQAGAGVEQEDEETRADQRQRNGEEKGQKFLTRLGGFGEEGHMQLHFLIEVSVGLVGFGGFLSVPSMSTAYKRRLSQMQ